jgi:Ca2+-binding EF-hand superfamily protein
MELAGEDAAHVERYRDEVRAIFDKVDVDQSGRIDKGEFLDAVRRDKAVNALVCQSRLLAGLVAGGELDKAFDAFDADGGGSLTFDEFWKFCKEQADENHIRELFAAIDADGSRFITREELAEAFRSNARIRTLAQRSKVFGALSEQGDWNRVVAEMDSDKSGDGAGRIDYVEFWRWCKHLAAKVLGDSMRAKARARAERLALEQKTVSDGLLSRLSHHSFRAGAGQGGTYTVSIYPEIFNWPCLPKVKGQRPASGSAGAGAAAALATSAAAVAAAAGAATTTTTAAATAAAATAVAAH